MRKFFAPEVVQTSGMDCGPAALKCLLDGFGTNVSYGRLREACQTGLDGTSIDTIETVANEMGLEAEQIMLPVDHLLLPEARALPAIVVVRLPDGVTHFVVAWRRIGNLLQIMDPAVGRRWISAHQFLSDVYVHRLSVGAGDWREFAVSDAFQQALKARLRLIGMDGVATSTLLEDATGESGWRKMATLDAATRLLATLDKAKTLPPKESRLKLLHKLMEKPDLIPQRCWSVTGEANDEANGEQVRMAGAVLVRVTGKRAQAAMKELRPELAAAMEAPKASAARELARAFWKGGTAGGLVLLLALVASAGGTLLEALLFRALLTVNAELGTAGERAGAVIALLLFCFVLLLLEAPTFVLGGRLGRRLENILRRLFLEKIPKLGDRYFQSRLTSDMAERSHAAHRLRHLPDQVRQLLWAVFQLAATCVGILWLDPHTGWFVLPAAAAAVLPVFCAQPALVERDLRARTHAAGLTRFYLDAMLGLQAIRAHGAARVVRQEHQKLLAKWAAAALRLQRMVVGLEALQLTITFCFVAALLLTLSHEAVVAGRVLLLAYWALNLPVLGQEIGVLARQYPSYRNLTLRLLEPLAAAEEERSSDTPAERQQGPPAICFRHISAEASGHTILNDIDLEIAAGSHVAIVGRSGAGKSTLVGMLLGWLKPSSGEILIDGRPLDCERLRASTAWVDPAVQLWNRSLFTNLSYGSSNNSHDVAEAIEAAMLRPMIEGLPEGLQTKLGEGGALVSGGEGQRVRFGRALLREDAKLVILDEPFRGLDRQKRRELLERARERWRGATLICITHDVAETQGFDRAIVIEGGQIAEQGEPWEMRSRSESRYAQLLASEEQIRKTLWASGRWRRISVQSGQILEKLTRTAKECDAESEVA